VLADESMGHFHVPKHKITHCFEQVVVGHKQIPLRACQKVLKNSGTAEFTSQLKNTFLLSQDGKSCSADAKRWKMIEGKQTYT